MAGSEPGGERDLGRSGHLRLRREAGRRGSVKGLGKAAYQIVAEATGEHGPSAEIGWLSSNGRILMLRYTFAKDQQKAAADELAPILVDMAKDLDVALTAK